MTRTTHHDFGVPSSRSRRGLLPVAAVLLAVPCALGLSAPGAVAAVQADDVFPTQAQVDAAKANAAQAAAMVSQIEAQYAAASSRLLVLQQQVSAAMAAVAAAQSLLQSRTAELEDAETTAADARTRQSEATQALRRDAAVMYQEQVGGLGQLSVLLGEGGPQRVADYTSAMTHVATQRQANVDLASDSANIAAEATRRASVARAQQQQAKEEADRAQAQAQVQVDGAQAETNRIQAEQDRRVADLANLRQVAVQVEQDRQDGLAREAARIAAQRAAAEAAARAQQRPAQGSWPSPPSAPTGGGGDPRATARSLLSTYGWGADQWSCLNQLWIGESGWNWSATNASSGAYGIPQSLPASKMASAGADWLTNPTTQVIWGMGYIRDRYGSPCAAWSFWLSQSPHWY